MVEPVFLRRKIMTDILNNPSETVNVPEEVQLAVMDAALKLLENYDEYLDERRQMFCAYFVYGNMLHDGQHAIICEELGITPHPTKADTVITFDGVELLVTIGRYTDDRQIPYDITYSTSQNGLRPPVLPEEPSSVAEV